MIGKIIKGSGFRGALNYLFNGNSHSRDKKSAIVATNMAGRTPRELSREFGSLRRLRSNLGKAVSHISLSLSPNDRTLTNEELGAIAVQFLNEMGYVDCPFVAVRHHDTEHPHIHLLASRIDTRGRVVSDKHDFKRAEDIIRKLEKMYGLKEVLHSTHAAKTRRTRRSNTQTKENHMSNTHITNLASTIATIRNASETMEEWATRCIANGINLKPLLNESGKVVGLMYRDPNGEWHKASSIGKEFQWNHIAAYFGIETDQINSRLLGKLSQQKNIHDNQIRNPNTTAKDDESARRNVMDEDYVNRVWAIFKPNIKSIKVADGAIILSFDNGGKILDEGSKITARGMSDKEASSNMVRLASLKGWQAIQFSGNEGFVRLAMEEALRQGLNVIPIDEEQAKMLEEIKRKIAQGSNSLKLEPKLDSSNDDEGDPFIDMHSAKEKLLGTRAISSGQFKAPSPSRKSKRTDRPE